MTTDAFSKIAGAQMTGGGANIRDGSYKFLIESLKVLQNGHTGQSFIAEFRVVEATPSGLNDEQGRPIVPNQVGSSCSMVANLTKHEMAAGNAKALIVTAAAGLGVTEDKVTAEFMGRVCSEQNPFRGVAIIDETYVGTNKGRTTPANAGKKLTLNKWKPIAQTQENVKAQRAWLDTNAAKVEAPAMFATPAPVAAPVAAPVQAPVTTAAPAPVTSTAVNPLAGILGL
jgi:hypothetical protein